MDLSAKRSTSLHHCSIRCTLTPYCLFGLKLCYVSRYLKNTSQQILDTGNWGVTCLNLNKLEFPSPKDALCQSGNEPSGSLEDEMWKVYRQTGNRRPEKLNWAFSSAELIIMLAYVLSMWFSYLNKQHNYVHMQRV